MAFALSQIGQISLTVDDVDAAEDPAGNTNALMHEAPKGFTPKAEP